MWTPDELRDLRRTPWVEEEPTVGRVIGSHLEAIGELTVIEGKLTEVRSLAEGALMAGPAVSEGATAQFFRDNLVDIINLIKPGSFDTSNRI